MRIRYRVLRGSEKVSLLMLALCALGATGFFYITALGFDPLTSRAAVHQFLGGSEESPIPEEYRSIVTSPDDVATPRAAASLVFLYLAGMAGLITLTALGTALFSTLAFLYLGVLVGLLVCIVGTGIALVRCFSTGGTLFGIFVVGVLAVELGTTCLVLWFVNRRFPDLHLSEVPLFGDHR